MIKPFKCDSETESDDLLADDIPKEDTTDLLELSRNYNEEDSPSFQLPVPALKLAANADPSEVTMSVPSIELTEIMEVDEDSSHVVGIAAPPESPRLMDD